MLDHGLSASAPSRTLMSAFTPKVFRGAHIHLAMCYIRFSNHLLIQGFFYNAKLQSIDCDIIFYTVMWELSKRDLTSDCLHVSFNKTLYSHLPSAIFFLCLIFLYYSAYTKRNPAQNAEDSKCVERKSQRFIESEVMNGQHFNQSTSVCPLIFSTELKL